MSNFCPIWLILAAGVCAGCAAPAPRGGAVAPADLPARIPLKTGTESFTHEWYVALRDGRIWLRPNEETTGRREPWRLLPPDGRAGCDLREITADGSNLVAIAGDGLVHYTKLYDFDWIETWGIPPFDGPLHAPRERRALAISHRGPLAAYYEDIDANPHPMSAGVTTRYLLSADGGALSYADPWLAPHFERRIALPRRDRFRAVALVASASTLFVVNAAGEMWTRLADYDTLGENPVLGYTYERGRRGPSAIGTTTRTLPPEEWAPQPRVPGRITRRIAILQTGEGNAARELRVEGVDAAGAGGYWRKMLRGETWAFVPTGARVAGPFLDPALAPDSLLGPRRDRDLRGRIESPEMGAPVEVELAEFNPDYPPAVLRLTAGGRRTDLALHMRAPDREVGGRISQIDGTIAVARDPGAPAELARALERLFGTAAAHVAVDVRIDDRGGVRLAGDAPGAFRRLRIVFSGSP